MKTPQVPAMPGMTPLGFEHALECFDCNRVTYAHHNHGGEWQCGVCGGWSTRRFLRSKAQDQKTVAERKWQSRKLAPAPQQPCDVGLFSDDAKQFDLMEKCK